MQRISRVSFVETIRFMFTTPSSLLVTSIHLHPPVSTIPIVWSCINVAPWAMSPDGTNLTHRTSLFRCCCIGYRTSPHLMSQRWSVRLLHLPFTVSLSCPYPFPSRSSSIISILNPSSSSSRISHIVPDRTEHHQSLPSRAIRQEFRLLFLIFRHQSTTSPLVFALFRCVASARKIGNR
jgi:hypothetical protein